MPLGKSYRRQKQIGGAISGFRGAGDVPKQIGTRSSVKQAGWYIGDYGEQTWDNIRKDVGSMFDKAIGTQAQKEALEKQHEENKAAQEQGRTPEQIKANPFLQFLNPNLADAINKTTSHLYSQTLTSNIQAEAVKLQNDIANDESISIENKATEFNNRFETVLEKYTENADISTVEEIAGKFYPYRDRIALKFANDAVEFKRNEQFRVKEDLYDELKTNYLAAARAGEDPTPHLDALIEFGTTLKGMHPTNDKEAEWLNEMRMGIEGAVKTGVAVSYAAGLNPQDKVKFIDQIRNGKEGKLGINITSEKERDDIIAALTQQAKAENEQFKEERQRLRDDLVDAQAVARDGGRVDIEDLRSRAEQLDPTGEFGLRERFNDLHDLNSVSATVNQRKKMSTPQLLAQMEKDRQARAARDEDTTADMKLYTETRKILEENRKAEVSYDGLGLANTRLDLGLEPADANGLVPDAKLRIQQVRKARAIYGDHTLFYTKQEMDQQRKQYSNASAADKKKMVTGIVEQFRSMGPSVLQREIVPVFKYWMKLDPGMSYLGQTIVEGSRRSEDVLDKILRGMESEEVQQ